MFKLAQQSAILSQVEAQSAEYTYDSNLVSSLNKASKTITKLFLKKTAPISAIENITKSAPEGINLNRMQFNTNKGSISIWGIASDRSTLFLYKDNLNQTNQFTSVRIPLSSLEDPRNIEFALTLTLKKGIK
ncbi:PilN domain-containing protein [Pseudomonadota bacterium]